jgi:hypothetical protein
VVKKVIGAAAIVAFVLLACAPRAEATSITVAGSTLGCFNAGCTFALSDYSGSEYGMWFSGQASFSENTNAGGTSNQFALGSFYRDTDNLSSVSPDLDFALQVTFTLPVGVGSSPATFTTVIVGKSPGGGGPVNVDFNNTPVKFTYLNAAGSGEFYFSVFDVTGVHKNTTALDRQAPLIGQITGATFNPKVDINPTATAPEPGSLVLLATGLTALGLRLRKSARKS